MSDRAKGWIITAAFVVVGIALLVGGTLKGLNRTPTDSGTGWLVGAVGAGITVVFLIVVHFVEGPTRRAKLARPMYRPRKWALMSTVIKPKWAAMTTMQRVNLVLCVLCGVLFLVSLNFALDGELHWSTPLAFAISFVVFLLLIRGYAPKAPKRED